MNRREAISHVALLLGGAFSAPTLLAMDHLESRAAVKNATVVFELNEMQRKIVAEVAEMIIPKTDTPGALEAGVPDFIELMLKDCYRQPEHISFNEGIQQLKTAGFLTKSLAEKTDFLRRLEEDTKEMMKAYQVQQSKMGDNEDQELIKVQAKGLPFWRLMKELTLLGYFTSEVGIRSSFDYVPIPGKLEEVKLKPNQKMYAY
ncbi:gluconate 2-dehydrogenase subunit 3 family protein [Arundinibacter roseus]|uniref:Gluconate 2-dehydrogenase subunit 3 family protein n=1 Tax=Arundinibacter roseus TaxID=2070510 RepID=A0A4R4KLK2_9BACT|nr:gluconate 2-dehydrogenase subunit 3 family protein [Arundinibacter roseus]TDB67481.1 gluconate 2-dehydrogenase subunit 3 family protein [Arundinibacter roseus]